MIPRTTNENVDTLEYWNGHPYNLTLASAIGQCVWYAMGRIGELLGYPMTYWESMPDCSPNPAWNYVGVRDAKYWLDNTRWKVSKTPVVGSVMVLDGYRGHVAIVEKDCGSGIFGISQYNKNSDKKFHYEEVNLTGTKCYGMTIKGFLIIPIKETERDKTRHQFMVKVDKLRIRKDHSTGSEFIRYSKNGELFNVLDEFQSDYRWFLTDDGWIATTPEWIEDYPAEENITEIETLKSMIREKDATIAELEKKLEGQTTLLKTCEDACRILNEKIDKAKEALR